MEALQEAGATFNTWCELVLNSSNDINVVKKVAEAATNVPEGEWTAYDGRHVHALALMLPHHQPAMLDVRLRPEALRKTHWADVVQHRQGDLRLVMGHGEPCDDMVEYLRNSHGRCKLKYFKGSLSSASGLTALAAAVTASTKLDIELRAPLQFGEQRVVLKRCRRLKIRTPLLGAAIVGTGAVRLPAHPLAELTLEDVPPGSWEAVSNTLLELAPPNKRFKTLKLEYSKCCEDNRLTYDLDRALVVLQRQDIRTGTGLGGHTRWDEDKNDSAKFKLHVTKYLPARLVSVRERLDMRDRIIELSNNGPEELRAEWPVRRDALQAWEACNMDWQDLLLHCPNLEGLPRLASKAGWEIWTGEDATATACTLAKGQRRRLEVRTTPQQLRGASWEAVASRCEEEIELEFPYYSPTPCDDLLTPLHGKKSQLTWFRGAIAEAASVVTLSAIAAPTSTLKVRLLTPLSLSALEGRCLKLDVLVRPFEATEEGSRLPLPGQPRPWLWVTDVQRGAWKDVVRTVQTLAPDDKRYGGLWLRCCDLTVSELNFTVAALQRGGVRTWHTGPTSWKRLRDDRFVLNITDKLVEKVTHQK